MFSEEFSKEFSKEMRTAGEPAWSPLTAMKTQPRSESLLESLLGAGTGMLISWCLTLYVIPIWGVQFSGSQAFEVTCMYSAMSFVRTYVWRRIFNAYGRGN